MTFFQSYIKELLDEGHTVDIATNDAIRKIPDCYHEFGCRVFTLSCSRSPLDVGNWKAYQHALKPHGFDMTFEMYKEHCDGYDYRTFLGLLFDITDEKLLTEIHDMKKAIYPKYYKFITNIFCYI